MRGRSGVLTRGRLYDAALAGAERRALAGWREELLRDVGGVVLEIGAGTGANLRWYGPGVRRLLLLEPDEAMRALLSRRVRQADARCAVVLAGSAGRLPLGDGSVDAVVSTLVLCTARPAPAVLAELRRVLRPGGRLHLIEHVAAPEGTALRRVQRLVAPVWRRLAGGCSPERAVPQLLVAAGFDVQDLRQDTLPVPLPWVRPVVRGRALPLHGTQDPSTG